MERRQFLGWISVGMLATNLPILLAACSSSNDKTATTDQKTSEQSATNSKITQDSESEETRQASSLLAIGTETELADQGFLFSREKKVIVTLDKSGKAIAFNPTCNHQGCLVDWDQTKDQFICPCHNSIFEADGKLVSGPATESLLPLNLKLENGSILVEV